MPVALVALVAAVALEAVAATRLASWPRLNTEMVGAGVDVGAAVVVRANRAAVPATLLQRFTGHVHTVPRADCWHASDGGAFAAPQARAIVPAPVRASRHVATPVPQSTATPSSLALAQRYCPAPPPVHSWHWIPVPLRPSSARAMSAAPSAKLLHPEVVHVHSWPLAAPAVYGWQETAVVL